MKITRRGSVRGFTLVELLAAVSIIVILLGIGVGVTRYASQRAETSRARADMERIATAMEEYRVKYGVYPDPGNTAWNRMATDGRTGINAYPDSTDYRSDVAVNGQRWLTPFASSSYSGPDQVFMERLMKGLPKSDPWGGSLGQSYEYRRTSRYAFQLRSVGPDSTPGTPDDVTLRD